MRKTEPCEIGSEFWSVPVTNDDNGLFPQETKWFLSGRSALAEIIVDIMAKASVKTAALPSWCCDSMIKPFSDAGIDVKFYPVFMENGKLVQDISCADGSDILFLMDYFGYTGEEVCGFKGIVIRDVTHSVFSQKYTDADYYFGSLRKWAGFWTGGFATGLSEKHLPQDEIYVGMRREAMAKKENYITGNSDSKGYLDDFGDAEEYLENCGIAGAAERDILLAQKLDVPGLKSKRQANARRLLERLADIAIFPEIKQADCPLFVPILVPDGKRDALRRHLIDRQIYCPVHWPLSRFHNVSGRAEEIYDNELSIVCDQRYGEEEMDRILKAVREF